VTATAPFGVLDTVPLTFDDMAAEAEINAITSLMDGDPVHARDRAAVVTAILNDGQSHNGQVDPNRVRDTLPPWVYPRSIGSTYRVLLHQEVLVFEGCWTENLDGKGRNVGKPQRLYRLARPC